MTGGFTAIMWGRFQGLWREVGKSCWKKFQKIARKGKKDILLPNYSMIIWIPILRIGFMKNCSRQVILRGRKICPKYNVMRTAT